MTKQFKEGMWMKWNQNNQERGKNSEKNTFDEESQNQNGVVFVCNHKSKMQLKSF